MPRTSKAYIYVGNILYRFGPRFQLPNVEQITKSAVNFKAVIEQKISSIILISPESGQLGPVVVV